METHHPLPTRERAPVDSAFSPITERTDVSEVADVIPIDRPKSTTSGLPMRRAGRTDLESFSLATDVESPSPVAPVLPIDRNPDTPDLEGLAERKRALAILHDLHRQADDESVGSVVAQAAPVEDVPVPEVPDTNGTEDIELPEAPAPTYDRSPRHRGTGRLTRFALRILGRNKPTGGKHKLVPGKHRAE